MNVTRCDRCLRYIEDAVDNPLWVVVPGNGKYDLCRECFLEFQQWIGQKPVERPRKRGCFG